MMLRFFTDPDVGRRGFAQFKGGEGKNRGMVDPFEFLILYRKLAREGDTAGFNEGQLKNAFGKWLRVNHNHYGLPSPRNINNKSAINFHRLAEDFVRKEMARRGLDKRANSTAQPDNAPKLTPAQYQAFQIMGGVPESLSNPINGGDAADKTLLVFKEGMDAAEISMLLLDFIAANEPSLAIAATFALQLVSNKAEDVLIAASHLADKYQGADATAKNELLMGIGGVTDEEGRRKLRPKLVKLRANEKDPTRNAVLGAIIGDEKPAADKTARQKQLFTNFGADIMRDKRPKAVAAAQKPENVAKHLAAYALFPALTPAPPNAALFALASARDEGD